MATIIESDSPIPAIILLSVMFFILLAGGLGIAYMGGVFTGKNDVIENDKRITSLNHPSPVSPESVKP